MFVFTADPIIEPPMMVINTVLSVMAYDYPAEKLSVYLSDDAGSDITFYALLEASTFAKHWVPFCKRFKVEPRSPAAYFNTLVSTNSHDHNHAKDLDAIKVRSNHFFFLGSCHLLPMENPKFDLNLAIVMYIRFD